MRFIVTLDPDVALDLKKLMAEKLAFKDAVNQTMLSGLHALEREEGKKSPKKAKDGGVK
jgi:hypothetical protein